MTLKKTIKKREEKSKIEQFCESFENENTQVSYKAALKQIKGLDTSTQEELWNLVESKKDINTDKKRRVQYIIKGYLKHHQLPFDRFDENLKKVEVNGKYIHTCDRGIEDEEPKPVAKQVKKNQRFQL